MEKDIEQLKTDIEAIMEEKENIDTSIIHDETETSIPFIQRVIHHHDEKNDRIRTVAFRSERRRASLSIGWPCSLSSSPNTNKVRKETEKNHGCQINHFTTIRWIRKKA